MGKERQQQKFGSWKSEACIAIHLASQGPGEAECKELLLGQPEEQSRNLRCWEHQVPPKVEVKVRDWKQEDWLKV